MIHDYYMQLVKKWQKKLLQKLVVAVTTEILDLQVYYLGYV